MAAQIKRNHNKHQKVNTFLRALHAAKNFINKDKEVAGSLNYGAHNRKTKLTSPLRSRRRKHSAMEDNSMNLYNSMTASWGFLMNHSTLSDVENNLLY